MSKTQSLNKAGSGGERAYPVREAGAFVMSAAVALGSLPSATWVDETLLSETDRAIVIRFGTFIYISTSTHSYTSARGLMTMGRSVSESSV